MGEELRPCPFCGASEPELGELHVGPPQFRGFIVECAGCSANIDRQPSEAEAITAWNTRAALAPPSEGEMPELPDAACEEPGCAGYTADQMRAYGELCRKAKP